MTLRKRNFEWYTWQGDTEPTRMVTWAKEGVMPSTKTIPGLRFNGTKHKCSRRTAIKAGQLILLPRVLGKSGKWVAA